MNKRALSYAVLTIILIGLTVYINHEGMKQYNDLDFKDLDKMKFAVNLLNVSYVIGFVAILPLLYSTFIFLNGKPNPTLLFGEEN